MGRSIRIGLSTSLASASIAVIAFAPGTALAGQPGTALAGQKDCKYDPTTSITTCTVGSSLTTTTREGGTYWQFNLIGVVGTAPTSIYVCFPVNTANPVTNCEYSTPTIAPQGGSTTYQYRVYESSNNTGPTGSPLTPISATALIAGDSSSSTFVLSGIPSVNYSTTTTTSPKSTTTTVGGGNSQSEISTTTTPTTAVSNNSATTTTPASNAGSSGSASTTTTSVSVASSASTSPPSSTSSPTGSAQQASTLTVPNTNTGELWGSAAWRISVGLAGLLGAMLVFPWKRRRSIKA